MKSQEHRAVGQAAAGGAMVEVGGAGAGEGLRLGFGDVVALSGDFFACCPGPEGSDGLFGLAAVPGRWGGECGTRDEVVCALKVIAVDGGMVDARFEPGGVFGGYRFTPSAAVTAVERRVRDRYLALAAANGDHFVTPDGSDIADQPGYQHRGGCFGSAVVAYRRLHEAAVELACVLGRCGEDQSRAMAREAAAAHYLTDAFAAGHLRTPVTAIRRFWRHRYPGFWPSLQRKVAADTAAALRQLAAPVRMVPGGVLYARTLAAVVARARGYPQITLGDLLARVFHDWDDSHGLLLDGGGVLFGDGHLDQGVGKHRAIAAARAGIDDVAVAYQLGAAGSRLAGQDLYRAVRCATHAPGDLFVPETHIPTPSPDNPSQNWQAADIRTLWNSPIVGTTGTTVGAAVEQTLRAVGTICARLQWSGSDAVEMPVLLGVPALRRWATGKARQAYHRGFLQGLTRDPAATVFAIVDDAAGPCSGANANDWPAGIFPTAA